ncbi:MAG: phytanoyl-CoA dioxygenase, partial [Congregibacter sp.]|nr:phytanoyl-CoA dioxygenase [Congregibacter sp.]
MLPLGAPADFGEAVYDPLTPSAPGDGAQALRARFESQGYLYFPAVLSQTLVASVLGDMLSVLAPHIVWDAAAAAPVLAGEPFFESDPLW